MATPSPRELANIRKAMTGAARTLAQLERTIPTLKARAIRAVQIEGKRAHLRMYERYAKEHYANDAGMVVRISPFGEKWARRKKRLRLDPRRGVARKGILKQIKSPLGFVKQPTGFTIDLLRPALTITGRATVGKSLRALHTAKRAKAFAALGAMGVVFQETNRRSFAVNDYMPHFVAAKAPGLGALARADVALIQRAMRDSVRERIEKVKGTARKALTAEAASKLVLRLDRIA